ncbi:MAG TPA: ABC transporter permease [Gemmatimonas sp.]|uniref:ABC transporter permease n=1 Tax=Gemmatimonas sp. TaxID=1962908 RepID=UPI002ED9D49A
MFSRRLLARTWQCALVILSAATLAFLCLHLAPGDPASALGENVTPEVRARMRALYGFDEPLLTQYVRWLGALLRGDLGWSTQQQRPVSAVLADALPNTLMLIVPAFALSAAIGMLVGAWQGVHARSRRDRITSNVLLVIYSVPEFWLAMALMLLFARTWQVLPATGVTSEMHAYMSTGDQLLDRLRHLVLPLTSVTLIGVATFARYQRNSMRDTVGQPFVRTATASGLPRSRVLRGAWRASVLPVITLGGILLPSYLAGVIFVEQIFSWPGLGYVLLRAIAARDYAVVAASVVLGSTLTALGAWLAEWLREQADPRLRTASLSDSPSKSAAAEHA